MKKLMKIFSLVLFLGIILSFGSTKSLAAEIKYTDNVIPNMTSDTSPSGVASASGIFDGRYEAWKAFDGKFSKETEAWVVLGYSGWLEYDFIEGKSITKYTLISRPGDPVCLQQMPKDWTFVGWNEENSTWDILDTQTGITDWQFDVKKEFTFVNTNVYKKYRINITANNGYGDVTIGELEMMETAGDVSQSTLKVVEEVGETIQLSVNDNLSLNTNMNWSSSNSSVATVDNQGVVTGVTPGNAVITVTNAAGTYKETINILVIESESQLAVDLNVGDTRRLTIDDLAGTANATWTSNDQLVATVDSKGKVTAIASGDTYITIKDDQGNEIGKIYVRVRN